MINYSLEHFVIRDRVLFGTGWILNKSQPYSMVRLRFQNTKGEQSIILASSNQKREDVFAAFPNIAHAAKCGFLIYGALTFSLGVDYECYIEASIDGLNWRSEIIPPTVFAIDSDAKKNIKSPFFARIKSPQARLVNLVNIFFSEGFSQLIKKIKNSKILEFKKAPISSLLLRRRLLQKRYESLVLIVDHNLGGGANVFRKQFIQKLNNENSRILLLTYDLPSLSYILRLESLGKK